MSAELEDFEALSNDIQGFSSKGIKPGLERVSRLLRNLGSPEKKFRTIQLLGTNGKGSTAATIESICMAAGMKTALYTSPHLISLQERLRVNGKRLPIAVWRGAFAKVVSAVESDEYFNLGRPTFFETLTALCFLIIAESGIGLAIAEAGMGGRYDATSSCGAIATVVTPIGLDHMEYLGETIESIASEKFAAVRSGIPAFYAADDDHLSAQFMNECGRRGAPCFLLSARALPEKICCTLDGTNFDYVPREVRNFGRIAGLKTPLVGIHQAYNASNAISVLLALKENSAGFEMIDERHIREGLMAVDWPGRMEIARRDSGSPVVILDGAHNEHGFRALQASLRSLVGTNGLKRVSALVFAVMRDKDISGIVRRLRMMEVPIFCSQPPISRAMPAGDLALLLAESGCMVEGSHENPQEALAAAVSMSGGGDIVVCCGSLFLVGAIRKTLGLR
jgi:dihydrofolate synthase/folylpolyglutamate synthase